LRSCRLGVLGFLLELLLESRELLLLRFEQRALVCLEPCNLLAERCDLIGGGGRLPCGLLWRWLEEELTGKRGFQRPLLPPVALNTSLRRHYHVADARASASMTEQSRSMGCCGQCRQAIQAGGVDDHHAGGGLDPGEAAPHIERPADLREIGGERIVAAGIEKHDAIVALHHVLQHEVELDGLEIEIGFGFEQRIDRSEEVPLIDLQAVASIIEESDIGAA
jgi:hypothetical protein